MKGAGCDRSRAPLSHGEDHAVDLKQSEHSYDDWVSAIEVGWLPGRVREVQVIPVHPHKFFSVRQDSKLDAIIMRVRCPHWTKRSTLTP